MLKQNFLKHFFVLTIFVFLAGFSFSSHAETTEAEVGAEAPQQVEEPQQAEEPEQYVQPRLIANQTQVKGGESIRIGLEQTIYPGWHVYWKNPGDSGTPTEINWELPPGFSVTELEWPVAKKILYGPLTNYGYEEQVTLLQNLTLPDTLGSVPFALKAKISLLVCHDICIPELHDVSIVFNSGAPAEPETIKTAESLLPIEKNWPVSFSEKDGQLVFTAIAEDVSMLGGATDIILLPEEWGAIDNNADASLHIHDNDSGFSISQKRGERALIETPEIPVVISYKTADGRPQSIRLVTQSSGQSAIAETDTSAGTSTGTKENGKPSISLWQALLFAILGGLVLNLMPCVFPVLSIKALSLINLESKDEKKARAYGLSYTAGILISFAAIGGTLLLLKSGGAQIGWGFQLQSPAVIILLTYLVFIIGLNLSGFFEFSGRLAGSGQKLTQQSGHRGAFFTGVLATLVATPCTAPFMGAAMGFALTQPAIISMMVFLSLGFGLALPYLALCYIPALRAKLPRPGHWMETFRQFLAFPMFITAVWLVWVLSQQINSAGVFCTLIAIVGIAFIIWLLRVLPEKGFTRFISQILLVISLGFVLASAFIPATMVQEGNTTIQADQNWEEFTPEKLSTLLEGNDAVFTNMTASWCITCKVNEKISLKTKVTKAIFAEENIQYLKGDWTNQNPDITRYLNSFGRSGVPLYVYYPPRDRQNGTRPDPIVLPQILTSGMVKKAIRPDQ